MLLALSAERARPKLTGADTVLAPAPAPSGRVDDLVDALMAQAQRVSDLAERSARQLEAADGAVKIAARDLARMFGIDQARFIRSPSIGIAKRDRPSGPRAGWHNEGCACSSRPPRMT